MPVCKRCDGDGCWVCYSSGFTGDHTEAKARIRVLQKQLREVKITDWVSKQKFDLLREQIEVAKAEVAAEPFEFESDEDEAKAMGYPSVEAWEAEEKAKEEAGWYDDERLDSDMSYNHFHNDPDNICG
jgi:hypothetical protein